MRAGYQSSTQTASVTGISRGNKPLRITKINYVNINNDNNYNNNKNNHHHHHNRPNDNTKVLYSFKFKIYEIGKVAEWQIIPALTA